jgi:hypothetical protein
MEKYLPGRSPIIKNLIPGLTERGKIKIGRKGDARQGQNGTFQLPQKLDHFIVTTLERGKDDNFLADAAVHSKLGDAPKRIPIRLLFDDLALNFQCRYSCYFGKTLFCSGDGEFGLEHHKDGSIKEVPCTCRRQDPRFNGDANDGKGKCKINGTLSVLIEASNHVGGVYKFRTTGYNSTVGIYSSLVLINGLTGGILAGIPLEMTIQPKVVTSPIDGKTQTVYVVGVEFPGDVQTLQKRTLELAQANADFRHRLGNVENEVRKMISCDADLVDQAGDIVDEFHPDENAPERPEMAKQITTTETTPAAAIAPPPAQEPATPAATKKPGRPKKSADTIQETDGTPAPEPVAAPSEPDAPKPSTLAAPAGGEDMDFF